MSYRGCNAYTNVVKNWLEFTRAIERDRVKGRYTERTSTNYNHNPSTTVSCQDNDTTVLSKGVCSNVQGEIPRGTFCD